MAYVPGLDAVQRALRGEVDDSSDRWISICADSNGRISPQHVADFLRITRVEAKSRLQAASSRGLFARSRQGGMKSQIGIRSKRIDAAESANVDSKQIGKRCNRAWATN
ncbi:hypothetical protein AWB74_08267 [Caballeronia arvi]|uniref:Uncharacterized protein n=1 Tax=Caballeronia arvi TaxID=1777135 RepID=A0A158L348_9BURK|nr:hypothetical protein AWB74_08267 [Caballeronia arvi]